MLILTLFKDLRFILFLSPAVVPMTFSLKVLYGSTMHLIVHQLLPGNPIENTTELWRQIRVEYHLQGTTCRMGTLKYSMFNPKGGAFFFS